MKTLIFLCLNVSRILRGYRALPFGASVKTREGRCVSEKVLRAPQLTFVMAQVAFFGIDARTWTPHFGGLPLQKENARSLHERGFGLRRCVFGVDAECRIHVPSKVPSVAVRASGAAA
jgi:hypothetical protein